MKKLLIASAAAMTIWAPAGHAGTRPDDRAVGPRSTVTTTAAIRPDNRGGIRAPGLPIIVHPSPATSTGFHWGAAAIGALVAGVGRLLAAGVALLSLPRRRRVAI